MTLVERATHAAENYDLTIDHYEMWCEQEKPGSSRQMVESLAHPKVLVKYSPKRGMTRAQFDKRLAQGPIITDLSQNYELLRQASGQLIDPWKLNGGSRHGDCVEGFQLDQHGRVELPTADGRRWETYGKKRDYASMNLFFISSRHRSTGPITGHMR